MSYSASSSGSPCGYSGMAAGGASSGYGGIGALVSGYESSPLQYHALAPAQYDASVGHHALGALYSGREAAQHIYQHAVDVAESAIRANRLAQEYAFVPDDFLKPDRAAQAFVGDAAAIEEEGKEAFTATTGDVFPADVRITILQLREFRKLAPDASVVGFSVNRRHEGLLSDIVLLAAEKDRALLTLGHELGHVLSRTLASRHDEEAKAFAFTRAWMDAIRRENIAGLRDAIVPEQPAQNGLHDVAFVFVQRLLNTGKEALEVYGELVNGGVGVRG